MSLPFKTLSSSSPEHDDIWDELFKSDRTTQPDYEECDEVESDDYSEEEDEQ